MYKNIYFLHIPKTAGRFVYRNLLIEMQDTLTENHVRIDVHDQAGISAHQAWCTTYIDDDTYIISIMRDPVKHLVSFYCHTQALSMKGTRISPLGGPTINKASFFNWIDQEWLKNYQVKNFIVEKESTEKFLHKELFKNAITESGLIDQKLSKVNLLLRNDDLTENNIVKIRTKILEDLGIDTSSVSTNFIVNPEFSNEDSTNLYNTLTKEEIDFLYKLSPIDKRIYEDDSYFWIP